MIVFTGHDGSAEWKKIGDYTERENKDWAHYHGHEYICFDRNITGRPASWMKINHLTRWCCICPDGMLGMWLDADAMVVGDFGAGSFFTPEHDLYMVKDQNGFNAGVFFFRNTAAFRRFLSVVWAREEFINHIWWEQAAIHALIKEGVQIKEIPSIYNSYKRQPGIKILHAAGVPVEQKLAFLKRERGEPE